MLAKTYRDLEVWKKSMDLVVSIYQVSGDFPKQEQYGLTSQMRRCAVSIPSNIAEGGRRRTDKDQTHFLNMAFGSGAELETQLEIARRLKLIPEPGFTRLEETLTEVMKMLNRMLTNRSAF